MTTVGGARGLQAWAGRSWIVCCASVNAGVEPTIDLHRGVKAVCDAGGGVFRCEVERCLAKTWIFYSFILGGTLMQMRGRLAG